ncbi:MAG TPA: hypothetical protein VHX43_10155 [Xanthobacteraceae bacterium]|jgi:hypothetical protein|nr:hypothetical protein [Xanthobacteraceae bacterium]
MAAGSALRKQTIIEEMPKGRAALMERPKERPTPRLFHARMVVTRVEEWCVEASTPEEAEALLTAGAGHRCTPGESIQVEIDQLLDE